MFWGGVSLSPSGTILGVEGGVPSVFNPPVCVSPPTHQVHGVGVSAEGC